MKQGLGVLLLSLDEMLVHRRVNSNMTPRLSGHFCIFGSVFFVLKSLLGITRQWSRKKISNFDPKASESCYGTWVIIMQSFSGQIYSPVQLHPGC